MELEVDPIFAQFIRAVDEGGPELVSEWIRQYPEHRLAMLDYALLVENEQEEERVRQEMATSDPAAYRVLEREIEAEEELCCRLADQALRDMAAASGQKPLDGLLLAARRRGLDAAALSGALRLGLDVLMRLDQRFVEPASVPRAFVQRAAEVLGRSVDDVARYLLSPPSLAARAHYKAQRAPRLDAPHLAYLREADTQYEPSRQDTFGEAVANSSLMADEDRAYWREQPIDGDQEAG